jgi:hypothetical protein
MSTPINTLHWYNSSGVLNGSGNRVNGYEKHGQTGNHVTPTPYYTYFGSTTRHDVGATYLDIPGSPGWSQVLGNRATFQTASNQAYKQFVSRCRDGISADMLTNIAEWNKTTKMIVNRVKPMIDFIRALRDPNRFLKSAKQRAKANSAARNVRRRARFEKSGFAARRPARPKPGQPLTEKFSSWYLEYSFGWAPTVADIVAAVRSLGRELPIGLVKGHGHQFLKGHFSTTDWTADVRVNCGGKVFIVNPNAALLDCLGLANPALTAWNLIPFSFLADWAFDVSTQLGSWSDLFGYSITVPYNSTKSKSWCSQSNSGKVNTIEGGFMDRRNTMVSPKANINVVANLHQSLHRAALSLALLGTTIRRSK